MLMKMVTAGIVFCLATGSLANRLAAVQESQPGVDQARSGLRKAVEFFRHKVAVEGGYVYQVTSDLQLREGEGDAGQKAVWVQPPGTPAVGLAYIEAFERTGEPYLLDAARDAASCLVRGQLHSGGWQKHIDFEDALRSKLAYRVDGQPAKKARNISSFDDDQTQAALRFLMKVDRALKFEDVAIHEATRVGLQAVVQNQFPNGAWSQAFPVPDLKQPAAGTRGNYPETWSREYPGGDYWFWYTLNDQALVRVMQTMWLAHQIYGFDEYRQSALRAANFLIDAQMPEPQPAWAQQYNYAMQPVWARKFEPPAISGGESQVVIDALLDMTLETGDRRFLAPIPRALAYLKTCVLDDGSLARFYELQTNRPLYFTRQYILTYDDGDLPTHYGFKVGNQLPKLEARYAKLKDLSSDLLTALAVKERRQEAREAPSADKVAKILASQEANGAWVEPGKLKYIKQLPQERPMLRSETFIKNVDALSKYIARHR